MPKRLCMPDELLKTVKSVLRPADVVDIIPRPSLFTIHFRAKADRVSRPTGRSHVAVWSICALAGGRRVVRSSRPHPPRSTPVLNQPPRRRIRRRGPPAPPALAAGVSRLARLSRRRTAGGSGLSPVTETGYRTPLGASYRGPPADRRPSPAGSRRQPRPVCGRPQLHAQVRTCRRWQVFKPGQIIAWVGDQPIQAGDVMPLIEQMLAPQLAKLTPEQLRRQPETDRAAEAGAAASRP